MTRFVHKCIISRIAGIGYKCRTENPPDKFSMRFTSRNVNITTLFPNSKSGDCSCNDGCSMKALHNEFQLYTKPCPYTCLHLYCECSCLFHITEDGFGYLPSYPEKNRRFNLPMRMYLACVDTISYRIHPLDYGFDWSLDL